MSNIYVVNAAKNVFFVTCRNRATEEQALGMTRLYYCPKKRADYKR